MSTPWPENVDEPWPELPADLAELKSYDLPTPVARFAVSLLAPARARLLEGLRRLPPKPQYGPNFRRAMQADLTLEVEKIVIGMQDDPDVIRCALAVAMTLGPSGSRGHHDDWFSPIAIGLRGPRVFEGLELDDLLALPVENLVVAECVFSGAVRAGRRDLVDALLARSDKTRDHLMYRVEDGWLSKSGEYIAELRRSWREQLGQQEKERLERREQELEYYRQQEQKWWKQWQ